MQLTRLNLPDDIKHLCAQELEDLAAEVRQKLLEVGQVCGGHLASNLGVVELTIAMHAVFSTPKDKFLWDTSHQTYVHKMLTGRLDSILTIRKENGLCGFANIFESPHDAFGAGHASTALSAALGFAHARELKGEDYSVISVIGDASLSGGMSFEALNNVDRLNSNFICILNDNNMSISAPVGSMAAYITQIRTSNAYAHAKHQFERIVSKIPRIGVPLRKRIEKFVDRLRDVVLDSKFGVLFEEFGFKYFGPIDGHNIPALMAALKYAKSYRGPVMIHILTTKGKGHEPAEADPVTFHGVSPKAASVSAAVAAQPKPKTYTQVFGEELVQMGARYQDMVVITPAMKEGSGLNAFATQFPDRFFDVGIAEEHAVTFAAGLARSGVRPVLAIYSTFLQRGFDQVIHDVCLQELPVIFALDRAGIVGEDGPTHHGVFDYAYLLPIPHMTILAPKDGDELKHMMHWAMAQPKAVSIRYPRGPVHTQLTTQSVKPLAYGTSELLFSSVEDQVPTQVLLIAVGSMVWPTYEAALRLSELGISSRVINLRVIKPLDLVFLKPYVAQASRVVVVEEGVKIGGVFSHVRNACAEFSDRATWTGVGLPDLFIPHGKQDALKSHYGLSVDHILKEAMSCISTAA